MIWDDPVVDDNADICAVHNEVKIEIAKADAEAFAESMNKQLVEWLADKNFPGVTEYPIFTINPAI